MTQGALSKLARLIAGFLGLLFLLWQGVTHRGGKLIKHMPICCTVISCIGTNGNHLRVAGPNRADQWRCIYALRGLPDSIVCRLLGMAVSESIPLCIYLAGSVDGASGIALGKWRNQLDC